VLLVADDLADELLVGCVSHKEGFFIFILRPCQNDVGYIDGRSQIKVHTDEQTQVHSAQSFPDIYNIKL